MNRTAIAIAVIALFTGGLGGAVFSWYINRPKPTVLTYNVVNTTTGADATTKGLVPNLKLRIGDEDVPVIYTHTIDLIVQSGPQVDSALVAVGFPTDFRLFGSDFQPPTRFHHMNCSNASYGIQCDIGPLAPGNHNRFRISLATNIAHPDEIFTTTNKVQLAKLDDYIGSNEILNPSRITIFAILAAIFGILTSLLALWFGQRSLQLVQMKQLDRLMGFYRQERRKDGSNEASG